VEVCFRLTEEQWQDFQERPGAYQVQHYLEDSDPPAWELLPMSTYEENFELCGLTARLSAFALAVLPQSEIPVTGPTVMSVSIPTSSVPRQIFQPYPTRVRERPSATPRPPTSTPVQPTVIVIQPTNTQVQPTRTNPPAPTNTRPPIIVLPTLTPIIIPTNTNPPTATNVPQPTATNEPQPSATNEPQPSATNEPQPSATNEPLPVEPSPTQPTEDETPGGIIDDLLGLVFFLSLSFLR
jgi:hypothetical protein